MLAMLAFALKVFSWAKGCSENSEPLYSMKKYLLLVEKLTFLFNLIYNVHCIFNKIHDSAYS